MLHEMASVADPSMGDSSPATDDPHQIVIAAPVTADGRLYQDFGGSASSAPTLCIQIFKVLLLKWYRAKKSGSTKTYVVLANSSIAAHAVTSRLLLGCQVYCDGAVPKVQSSPG